MCATFSSSQTSYGGLELLRRYLRRIDLVVRLRQAFAGLPSDYGSPRLALVLLALFYAYLFRSLRTLCFLFIARAGRLTRLGGRNVLRLTQNPATDALYGRIAHHLAA